MYKGIKDAKALSLAAIFEIAKRYNDKEVEHSDNIADSEYLLKKYENRLINQELENFILIILDRHKRIIHEATLYKGNNHKLSISFHDIFKLVMMHDGFFIYVIHNHPSGTSRPSKEDIVFTRELANRCDKMEISLIDHLIIAKDGHYSFLKENYFKNAKKVA